MALRNNWTDGEAFAHTDQNDVANEVNAKVDKATLTAKGDLYVATNSGTVTNLGVGTNNQVLTADSAQTAGVKWSTLSASSVTNAVDLSSAQTLTNKTLTSPRLNQILDTNGATSVSLTAAASAVNYLTLSNKPTGQVPQIESAGSDANIGLALRSKGTGIIYLSPGQGAALELVAQASTTNYTRITGTATGVYPTLQVLSTADTNVGLNVIPKGTGTLQVNSVDVVTTTGTQTLTNKTLTSPTLNNPVLVSPITTNLYAQNTGTVALALNGVASSVNYFQLQNAATGGNVQLMALGSDTNVNMRIMPKGTGALAITAGNGQNAFVVFPSTTAANYVTANPAATGAAPNLTASGSDTNVDLNLRGQGTGIVQANGVPVVTTTGSQTLTNKTLTSPAITTPTGIVKGDVGLGSVDNTADAAKNVLSATKLTTARTINGVSFDGTANITVADSTKQATSEKGQANGYASLDGGGKVPVAQLPNSIMEYQGVWNASTNTPTLADGTGSPGDVYRISVGGTRNLGSGSITYDVGDYVLYNGTVWEKSDTTDAVGSVNGYTGNITLTKSDVGLGNVDNTSDATKNSATATLTNKTLSSPRIATILDANGNNVATMGGEANAVNYLWFRNSATGNQVQVRPTGPDANISLGLNSKGTGSIFLMDSGSYSIAQFIPVTTPANYWQFTQASAGNTPTLGVTGSDTNVSLNLITKGSGTVRANNVDVVTTTGSQTLTNKTLTSPTVNNPAINTPVLQGGDNDALVYLNSTATNASYRFYTKGTGGLSVQTSDSRGIAQFSSVAAGTAVNYTQIVNAATGVAPYIAAVGSDTNIDLDLKSKGTGVVEANGIPVVTTSGTQTLTNKTFSDRTFSTYNTASGLSTFSIAKTVLGNIHVQNGAGASGTSQNQAAITFQGSVTGEAQAGIYVLNNSTDGTRMGFATTNNYGTGPILFMTGSNTGVVNFPRALPQYNGVNLVSESTAQTLSNKTLALGSNTISGTTAQFNAALTDNDFATLAGTETLTNKSLTAPTITGAAVASGTLQVAHPASVVNWVGDLTNDSFDANSGTAGYPANVPFGKYTWHDQLRYGRWLGHPTYETYDGTAWSSQTLVKDVFSGDEVTSHTLANGTTTTAVRWTWNSGNLAYGGIQWWMIGYGYTSPAPAQNVVIESSADGTTWTNLHTSSSAGNAVGVWYYSNSNGGHTRVRLTITSTNAQPILVNTIKACSLRASGQGGGAGRELPYNADGDANITTVAGLTVTTPGTTAGSAVTIDGTQTLTNKTLTSPTLTSAAINNATALTMGTTTSTATATPIRVGLGGTYGNNAAGNAGNLKLAVFDDGTSKFGLGISNQTMEYQVVGGSAHRFYIGGSEAFAVTPSGVTHGGVAVPTISNSATLSNKTIALGSNTVSGTLAQFNTAVTDADLVSLAGTETLTNKTLTSPKINQILDTNGNAAIVIGAAASAVNRLQINNNPTGSGVQLFSTGTDTNIELLLYGKGTGKVVLSSGARVLEASSDATAVNYITLFGANAGTPPNFAANGTDTNIGINLSPKGTGTVTIGGVPVVTTSGTQTLTNKTLTDPKIVTIRDENNLPYITASTLYERVYIGPMNRSALEVVAPASAVNRVGINSAATGSSPSIGAMGSDTNVSLNLYSQGTGTVKVNNVDVTTTTGTQTLTNKTFNGITQFWSTGVANDDWQNSPISILERGLVGTGQSGNEYSPNLNFHWSSRYSNSLWMNSSGQLNWGSYTGAGVPAADGTINAAAFNAGGVAIPTISSSSTLTNKTISGSSNTLSNISIDSISDEHRLFNNMGDGHATRTAFDAAAGPLSVNYGWRYVQGTTNGPGTNSATQYYSLVTGLGDDYAATAYAMQLAIPRNVTNPYISIRYNEGSVLGAWQKISAGQADTLTTGRTFQTNLASTTAVSFNGSANITPGVTGTLPVANGGTGATTLTGLVKGTGTTAMVAAVAGTDFVAPGGALGTPSSGTLTNCTFPTLNQNTTGSAATLTTARTIALSGAVTGTATSFNGSANITIPTTVTATQGGVIYGSSATAYASTGAGTAGYLLVSGGTGAPTWVPNDMTAFPGSSYKKCVQAATTANITLSAPQTIDGVAVVAGNRVLVKNQSTASQNGIYQVEAAAWTRVPGADSSSDIASAIVSAEGGTANGGKIYATSFKITDTLGTTAMNWYQVYTELDAASAATASKLMLRDSNGYAFAAYFNNNHAATTRNTDTIFYTSTDDYIRKNTVAGAKTSLALNNVDNTSDATKNAATATLTNKTLTDPKINVIKDTLGNNGLSISAVTSGVNYTRISGSATGVGAVAWFAEGTDTNIAIQLAPKGNGRVDVYSPTGQTPTLMGNGPDTNHSLNLTTKGTGTVQANGSPVVTPATTHAATLKTVLAAADEFLLVDSEASWALKKTTWQAMLDILGPLFATVSMTFTNKRITSRIGTEASNATPTINCDLYDQYNITALAANITSVTVTGTPTDGQKLMVRIKGTAARTIAWGASFVSSGVAVLPTTTMTTKTHLVGFLYDSAAAKWVCVASDSTGY